MIIRSLGGKALYSGDLKTIRKALEHCAEAGRDLSGADVRAAGLCGAMLDDIRLAGACLWGCNLGRADLSHAILNGADLRNANLESACLVGSDLRGADLRGAYFERTLFEGARLEDIRVSCPSFWNCDFSGVASFCRVSFIYKGEQEVILDAPPIVLRGGEGRLVLLADGMGLWNADLYRAGKFPAPARRLMTEARGVFEKMLRYSVAEGRKTLSLR